jgi:hypothetical protein
MARLSFITLAVALLFMTGCASQADFLNSRQDIAMQTAVNRARFDMNCSNANGQMLSREVTQPAFQGPAMMGEERGLFTIGVEGCGQRQTYQVVCPMGGDGCTALEGRLP